MAHIERVIDPVTAAVLFDLHDPTGAQNPYGLQTRIRSYDNGSLERTQTFLEPDSPIDQFVYGREPRVRWQRIIRCTATSYDNLRQALGQLHRLLRAPRVIHHQPQGQAEALYLDTLPAPSVTPLLRGQGVELEKRVIEDFEDVDYLVTGWRQAAMRSPELDPAAQGLVNGLMLEDVDLNGVPTGWTSLAGTHSIVADQDAYQNSHTAAVDLLRQDVTASPGQTWTLQGQARRVSGDGVGRLRLSSVGGAATGDTADITNATWPLDDRPNFSVTVAMDALTTAARAICRQHSASGTTILQFRRLQLRQLAAVSAFRARAATLSLDPSV